mmetsp:Transcript_1639/g.3564  ORF Transcript_1639/g.3564 Transcript_1639/m.3564 type:complete len:83 (+) Transcript_1639:1414-1662(+)
MHGIPATLFDSYEDRNRVFTHRSSCPHKNIPALRPTHVSIAGHWELPSSSPSSRKASTPPNVTTTKSLASGSQELGSTGWST